MPDPEQMADYAAKTGDACFRLDLPVWEFDSGFFNYFIEPMTGDMCVLQGYGDARQMAKEVRALCRRLGCGSATFVTRRNGAAFARLVGGRVTGTVVEVPLDG